MRFRWSCQGYPVDRQTWQPDNHLDMHTRSRRPQMKLWILKRLTDHPEWDVNNGFVIRAETAEAARVLASQQRGDEGAGTWLKSEWSSCHELTIDGPSEVVLTDFNAG
jgi:hypothetical protein